MISLLAILLSTTLLLPGVRAESQNSKTSEYVSTVYMNDKTVTPIQVSQKGTVISFPTKPSKVILGNSGAFGIEYVERDIAITPLSSGARANLFVYLLGRRFSFDLIASKTSGQAVVMIKDQIEEEKPTLPQQAVPPKFPVAKPAPQTPGGSSRVRRP